MDKPHALRLADELVFAGRFAHESEDQAARRRVNRNTEAAAELRRLHQANQELVEALESINSICKSDLQYRQFPSSREYEIINICEPLIAKHKEQE